MTFARYVEQHQKLLVNLLLLCQLLNESPSLHVPIHPIHLSTVPDDIHAHFLTLAMIASRNECQLQLQTNPAKYLVNPAAASKASSVNRFQPALSAALLCKPQECSTLCCLRLAQSRLQDRSSAPPITPHSNHNYNLAGRQLKILHIFNGQ